MISELDPAALQAAVPRLSGSITLAALEGAVEVLRDTYGVPHVRTGSLHDAFFAQGFVTAQDRLWQMECATGVGPTGAGRSSWARPGSQPTSRRDG